MPPYSSNPLNEISVRLEEIKTEITHVQHQYEAALLQDKPFEILKNLKNRLLDLKRKHGLYLEAAKQRRQSAR
jgi:hypothetical protein